MPLAIQMIIVKHVKKVNGCAPANGTYIKLPVLPWGPAACGGREGEDLFCNQFGIFLHVFEVIVINTNKTLIKIIL